MIITVARKHFPDSLAVNAIQNHTGLLYIDGCRIDGPLPTSCFGSGWKWHDQHNCQQGYRDREYLQDQQGKLYNPNPLGRFPTNVLVLSSVDLTKHFPVTTSGTGCIKRDSAKRKNPRVYGSESRDRGTVIPTYGDTGSAARFFKQIQQENE